MDRRAFLQNLAATAAGIEALSIDSRAASPAQYSEPVVESQAASAGIDGHTFLCIGKGEARCCEIRWCRAWRGTSGKTARLPMFRHCPAQS
jgi:hypothetical protein